MLDGLRDLEAMPLLLDALGLLACAVCTAALVAVMWLTMP